LNLKKEIIDAGKRLNLSIQKLFVKAFNFAFGNTRSVNTEARSAYRQYSSSGTLVERAKQAFSKYLAHLATA
jgi:hypothetical protein